MLVADRRTPRFRAAAGLALAALGCLAAAGCASASNPTPAPIATPSASSASAPPPSPSASASEPVSSPSTQEPTQDQVRIDITIAKNQVTPSGQKLDVPLNSTVVLSVTSDIDDEIHAHTGGDGYDLEVKAGQPTTGRFTVSEPGSFEVESHHLEKIIVILNVR